MYTLSIIVPCFNEESTIPIFWKEAKTVVGKLADKNALCIEFLFIDDGSTDQTLPLLRTYAQKEPSIHYVSFSRNFGKEAAVLAGFQYAKGDFVVVMDADLQHPPYMLNEMYKALSEEGYDIVAARRTSRKGEPPIRSLFAKIFYHLMNKISKADFIEGASDFRMFSRRAVDAILSLKEYNRFSKGIFGWIGFKTKWIPYENRERAAGESKWSFWKLFLYSLEGILAFSTVPLSITSVLGCIFCLVAVVWLFVIVVRTFLWGETVAGFPTLACLLLLIGGSLQISLGIMGQYLAKTYLETKNRPIFIISETSTFD